MSARSGEGGRPFFFLFLMLEEKPPGLPLEEDVSCGRVTCLPCVGCVPSTPSSWGPFVFIMKTCCHFFLHLLRGSYVFVFHSLNVVYYFN